MNLLEKELREKINKLYSPFPSELPGTDTKIDFDQEDDRILSEAEAVIEGKRSEVLAPFIPSLKREITRYVALDNDSKEIYAANVQRLKDLEEIVVLANNLLQSKE